MFGLLGSAAFIVLFACPLLAVVIVPGISAGATIGVYAVGLTADALAAVAFVFLAVRYSARAARGELFTIPLVSPIVDTLFRLNRS